MNDHDDVTDLTEDDANLEDGDEQLEDDGAEEEETSPVLIYASWKKADIVKVLLEEIEKKGFSTEGENKDCDAPDENMKKDQLVDFAVELLGADQVETNSRKRPPSGKKRGGGSGRPKKEKKALGDWTREECEEDAAKYADRSEWNRRGKEGHAAARHNGWLDEIMPTKRGSTAGGTMTKESVIALMQKYESRSEFGRRHRTAFKFAVENELIDEYLPKASPGARKPKEEAEGGETEGEEDANVEFEGEEEEEDIEGLEDDDDDDAETATA